ncbi:hypothetical protein ACWCXB_20485 [Streptomyces sp. NPDC001514]
MKTRRLTRVISGLALVAGIFAGATSPATAQSSSDAQIGLVSYNVCGGWEACQRPLAAVPGKTPGQRAGDWAAEAVGKAQLGGADVIMLQELCKGQYDALLPQLPGYAGYFASTQTYGGCGAWGSDTSLGQAVR